MSPIENKFVKGLQSTVRWRMIKSGEAIYKEGDNIDCVAFILAGFAASDTDDFTIGHTFGENGLLASLEAGQIMKGAIEMDIVAKSDLEMLTWKYKHAIDIVAQLGEKFKSELDASLKEYAGTFHSKAWRAILKNEKLCKLLKAQRLEYEFVRMLKVHSTLNKATKY